MASFAVIETGGKQYKVSAGDKIKVEKLNVEPGAGFSFDKILLLAEQRATGEGAEKLGKNWDVKIGTPHVAGAKAEGKVLRQARERKKIVFKYHSKTRYRKKKGHRQFFTEIEITKI